jgi:hypothetical protein
MSIAVRLWAAPKRKRDGAVADVCARPSFLGFAFISAAQLHALYPTSSRKVQLHRKDASSVASTHRFVHRFACLLGNFRLAAPA